MSGRPAASSPLPTAVVASAAAVLFVSVLGVCAVAGGPDCCPPWQRPLDCKTGATCCATGEWKCNDEGWSTCEVNFFSCACNGIAGTPCAEGEYCKVDYSGSAGCSTVDAIGVCTREFPSDNCSSQCEPVCSCFGTDFINTCQAFAADEPIYALGPCDDRYVRNVRWYLSPQGNAIFAWEWKPDALSYNIYRHTRTGPPQQDAGECFFAGFPLSGTELPVDPEPGEAWLFQIAAVFRDGEGPLGVGSDCTVRATPSPCTESSPGLVTCRDGDKRKGFRVLV